MNEKLASLRKELTERGIKVDDLVVCFVSTSEMILGEISNPEDYRDPDLAEDARASIMEKGDFVSLRNPRRILRVTRPTPAGLNPELIFSDFDMVDAGIIEVRPSTAFFLSWTNNLSQQAYYAMYVNWLKGRDEAIKQARLRSSGLVASADPSAVDKIAKLQERFGRR